MNFKVQSKVLKHQLTAVSKVVNSKNTLSILDNFLFDIQGTQLVITASDQDTTIVTRIALNEVEGEGRFAVDIKSLLGLLKELPDQELSFDVDDDNLEIRIDYQNGKFNFLGKNGNEYPQKAPSEDESVSFVVPAKEIVDGINHTLFAVGVDDIRPVMMGILWDIHPNEVVFVASDTHKLVRYRNMRIETGLEASFILPTKPASILNSILEKSEEDVKVTLETKCAVFESADYTVYCRFVEGKYPNYNAVIPRENPFKLTIDRVTLLNALRRVSVFKSTGGLIKFDVSDNEVYLKSQNVDYSTLAEETVACDYQGDGMVIGFNDVRVIEVLNNIECETVVLMLSEPSRAGIFMPAEQAENEDLLVLLMPMMI